MDMRKDIDKCPKLAEIIEKCDELSRKVEELATIVQHIERDYNRTQISRYQVLTRWIFVALDACLCICGILYVIRNEYPLWISLSFIYMLILLCCKVSIRIKHNRRYLRGIEYDLKEYWTHEELKLQVDGFRQAIRSILLLSPVLIHTGFVAAYLYSVSEIDSMGGYWWQVIALLFIVLMVSASVAGKHYRQLILSSFKNEI